MVTQSVQITPGPEWIRTNYIRAVVTLIVHALFFTGLAPGQSVTFTNPLLPSGADPWVIYKDGWYYYTHTTGVNVIVWKTSSVTELRNQTGKVIWTPPKQEAYSRNIWAPELHYLRDKWYVYFAADDGQNRNHRLYVIENDSED